MSWHIRYDTSDSSIRILSRGTLRDTYFQSDPSRRFFYSFQRLISQFEEYIHLSKTDTNRGSTHRGPLLAFRNGYIPSTFGMVKAAITEMHWKAFLHSK